MRRRELIAGLAGAAAWPRFVRAQQRGLPVVGFLATRSQEEAVDHKAAFLRGLERTGYVEERNVQIEYRWVCGRNERLGAFAAELAGFPVSVLVAGGDPSAAAAKAAAGQTPIVFMIAEDPVRAGLVASFSHPQGNATGISLITSALGSKRLEVMREMVPGANPIALLINPDNPSTEAHAEEVRGAAQALGRNLVVLSSRRATDFAPAFGTLRAQRAGALVVQSDPFFDSQRNALIALALRHAVPAIYHIREFPFAGGLVSYGPSLVDGYEQLGAIAGRVLKGERPADLPVTRPTKFELVINLTAAKALAITVPLTLGTSRRGDRMKRREVIAGFAAAGAWPHAASGQQTPLIGLLSSRSPGESRNLLSAFRRGLGESGYVEGQNLRVEYRFGLGQYDVMVALARELASRPLAVLISVGGDPAALAARAVAVTTRSSRFSALILSNSALLRVLTGPAETSPGSAT